MLKTWERKGYKVEMRQLDDDVNEFNVVKNDEILATLTPESIEHMDTIIENLNQGKGVEGWKDENGEEIQINS